MRLTVVYDRPHALYHLVKFLGVKDKDTFYLRDTYIGVSERW